MNGDMIPSPTAVDASIDSEISGTAGNPLGSPESPPPHEVLIPAPMSVVIARLEIDLVLFALIWPSAHTGRKKRPRTRKPPLCVASAATPLREL
jgi:hypothetical protein